MPGISDVLNNWAPQQYSSMIGQANTMSKAINQNLYDPEQLQMMLKLLGPLFARQRGNLTRAQETALGGAQRSAGAYAASRGIDNAAPLLNRARSGVYSQFAPQFGALEEGQLSALLGTTAQNQQFRNQNFWNLQNQNLAQRQLALQEDAASFDFFRDSLPGLLSGGGKLYWAGEDKMANQWQYNQVFSELGGLLGAKLQRQREEEKLNNILNMTLNRQDFGAAVNPSQGDLSPRVAFDPATNQSTTPRQDLFEPQNMQNLMSLLQKSPQLFQGLMAIDQMNRPETKIFSGDPEGVYALNVNRRTGQAGDVQTLQQPIPKVPLQQKPVSIPTGQVKTEGGVRFQEVQDVDPFTRQPVQGSVPRWEPWTNVPVGSGGGDGSNLRFDTYDDPIDGQRYRIAYDKTTNKEVNREPIGDVPDTADMRNRVAARTLVKSSIDKIKGFSDSIITKVGPSQRLDAIKRGVEAVFGNDPQFRAYQDARMALAGNLAVAQQGSRPSDADIKAIWLPLVPDPYRDTEESARIKWDIILTASIPEPRKPGIPRGGQPSGKIKIDY